MPTELDDVPELRPFLDGADHVDVKTVESTATLREFVAAAISWQPFWLKGLFAARAVFARLLRLNDPDVPAGAKLRPQDIPFTPGGKVHFFTVTEGAEDRYLVMEAADSHLTGYLAVVADPGAFRVATIVRYHRWTGPLYFNVIRPFHHLVVGRMASAGARAPHSPRPPRQEVNA
ncbi:DUF2867 domain-containing protein [Actinomadura barringtoniae]|uniref:DUF2867 domain-containing protein n=1 Tax=Actinomadura barringtoniae TaxID=1427535 RepID=A0A939PFF5_9ACTN|nr:DUF2867 domain-containing protein [Actinomadura barringtoniae]MBO2447526.1 DUF2867 domain-containing protein [Actinomadura barringtoniae]